MADRRQIPVTVVSVTVQVGMSDVELSYLYKMGIGLHLTVKPDNLKPLHLDIEMSRKRRGSEFFQHDLAHRVIYYATTGKPAVLQNFDYGDFAIDSNDLAGIAGIIRSLVLAGEKEEVTGDVVIGT